MTVIVLCLVSHVYFASLVCTNEMKHTTVSVAPEKWCNFIKMKYRDEITSKGRVCVQCCAWIINFMKQRALLTVHKGTHQGLSLLCFRSDVYICIYSCTTGKEHMSHCWSYSLCKMMLFHHEEITCKFGVQYAFHHESKQSGDGWVHLLFPNLG